MAKNGDKIPKALQSKCEALGIDWQKFLTLDNLLKVLSILQEFLKTQKPALQAKGAKVGCNHHSCCLESLALSLQTSESIASHLCECCDGDEGGDDGETPSEE